jgi:hypothetical protein
MEMRPEIRRFSLLHSQNPSNKMFQSKVQHLLYYAESRFWTIWQRLINADSEKNKWGQKLLHRELVNKLPIKNF